MKKKYQYHKRRAAWRGGVISKQKRQRRHGKSRAIEQASAGK